MRLFSALLLIAGLLLPTLPVSAHHSTNDIYDNSQTVEVTGVVKEWRLVNPHPFLVIEVTTPEGEKQDWDLSFGGSAVGPLARQGYKPETFRAGEVIIATGAPARAPDAHGLLIRGGLKREDGTPVP
jgi:Family of unknown function (DUF6152)